MQELKFEIKVSKGSRFNQVYVPKELEADIQPGDLVEVKLISKASTLYFNNVKELSEFKRKLILEVIRTIKNNASKKNILISQIFFIGSFLTEKVDYNDIDIVIVTDSKQSLEEELADKFNLKFHILTMKEGALEKLLQICPLTISMFSKFISDKEFKEEYLRKIDQEHIQSLLMMPQDLLEIDLNSKVFFDNLRRLTAIERFLENKNLNAEKINQELKELLGERIFKIIKNNELIDDDLKEVLRKHIAQKLNKIKGVLKIE